MNNNNLPAFAAVPDGARGLTKLEYVSIAAMQGILSSINKDTAMYLKQTADEHGVSVSSVIATSAIENAKEILKQLEKEK